MPFTGFAFPSLLLRPAPCFGTRAMVPSQRKENTMTTQTTNNQTTNNQATNNQATANPEITPSGAADKPANRPAFDAVVPLPGENGETNWQKVGAAWAAKGGFNLVLTELPFAPDGKQAIYLRPRQPFNKGAKAELDTSEGHS
jgi:hypothetical protein